MRVLLKIHDKNEPEKWTHMELAFDMNEIENIKSIELTVSHKLGEQPELREETQFNKLSTDEKIVKHSITQGQFQQIKYYTRDRVQNTVYEQNLAQARMYHTNEIDFIEPIMNFSKPFQTDEISVLDDDNSTTGPKTSRRTSITSHKRTKSSNAVFSDAPDVYKIRTGVRNSNCFGRRSYPYKLYQANRLTTRLNMHSNKIIPHDVMKAYDPELFDVIYDRIKNETGQTTITDDLWNRYAAVVGKEREGSTDGSSRSHSIVLVRSAKRSQCESPRSQTSDSPKSPFKDEKQYDEQHPQDHGWRM